MFISSMSKRVQVIVEIWQKEHSYERVVMQNKKRVARKKVRAANSDLHLDSNIPAKLIFDNLKYEHHFWLVNLVEVRSEVATVLLLL